MVHSCGDDYKTNEPLYSKLRSSGYVFVTYKINADQKNTCDIYDQGLAPRSIDELSGAGPINRKKLAQPKDFGLTIYNSECCTLLGTTPTQ